MAESSMTSTRPFAMVSSMRLSQRPPVDDGIRKPADVEQRGDAAHRFRVAQTYESARPQALVEVFRGQPPGGVVEIHQDVAAKNDVEISVGTGLPGIDDIRLGELKGAAELGQDTIAAIVKLGEVTRNQILRKAHEGTLAVGSGFRGPKHGRIDIRPDDLDLVSINLVPVLQEPDGDRIRFLAGRAWHRPDADRLSRLLLRGNHLQERRGQAAKLVILAIEISLVDGEAVDQMLDLVVGIRPQRREVDLK